MPNVVALPAEVTELVLTLKRRGLGGVIDSTKLTRALYSSDASLYRQVPAAVAEPRSAEELARVLEVARDAGLPVTMRGGGTSIAGNSIGTGVVVDTSRHLDRILAIDPDARTVALDDGTLPPPTVTVDSAADCVLRLEERMKLNAPHFGFDVSTAEVMTHLRDIATFNCQAAAKALESRLR